MHVAAEIDDIETMRLLSARGCLFDLPDTKGMQIKHYAALQGKTEILEEIHRAHVSYSLGPYPLGPLDEPKEEPLHKKGTQPPKEDLFDGATPLHMAAFAGQKETVKWLLDRYAQSEAKNRYGDMIPTFASICPTPAVLQQFAPYRMLRNPLILYSALRTAIRHDNIDSMRFLYKQGVGINTPLLEGNTGLHIASRFGALSCTAWLLQNEAVTFLDTYHQENVFELSAAQPCVEQFQLLLDFAQPPLDDIQHETRTLMQIAAKAGHIKNVMALIVRGASANAKGLMEKTALHEAVEAGHFDIVEFLLACGADTTAKKYNDTPLPIEMAHSNNVEPMKRLFKASERVRRESKEGETRLHFAVRSANPLAVLTLAQIEDVEHANCDGQTPLDLAEQMGLTQEARVLCSKARSTDIPL